MTASDAEERLAGVLTSHLAAPWAIYRNAAWLEKQPGREPADGEADLVVAHPELGVMVIEVKGGGVRRVNGRWESVDRNGTAHEINDPFAQVTRQVYALRRVCEGLPAWPAHSVRFCRAVAFPDAAYPRQLVPDGPPEIVIDADDLASARATARATGPATRSATRSATSLDARLREIFAWWQARPDHPGGAPGEIGMRALHTLLARDIEIVSPLAVGIAADEAIIRLSDQQFAVLDLLSSQRRALILGVAGSGKTLLAAEKARRLARQGFEVLLTCFNRPLSQHLAASIGQTPGVTVSTFHALAERFGQRAGIIGASRTPTRAYFNSLPDVLDRALKVVPQPRYDAIVVDEAQDIDALWWLPLLDLLGDRARGIMYVFGDANQDLYHARQPAELGVLLPDDVPRYHLTENRRTTRAIHEFAARYAAPQPDADASADGTDGTDGVAAQALGPHGRPVEVFRYPDGDGDACRRAVLRALRQLIDAGGVAAADLVVLTPRRRGRSWLMNADGSPVELWPYRLMPEYGLDGAVNPLPTGRSEVRVATIHRFKGLESPVVVLAELDGGVPAEQLAGLVYVGATRARSHLVVIGSESVERGAPA
ncbi:MAG: hypothetical protein DLM71_10895 [Chloroflexi bacterium]|nr:MAG: hypothetical protein DLM71_10895 [Chloroflexota bacterium]